MPLNASNDLAALVGSRICHDLINPLGAIGNGMELLGMAGGNGAEERALISDSVSNANAKTRFLRIAFGFAREDQGISRSEVLEILTAMAPYGRLSYRWNAGADATRLDARFAFLALLCAETALPHGGDIEVDATDGTWQVQARHDRLKLDPELWTPLSKGEIPPLLTPAQVQFGVLADLSQRAKRPLGLDHGDDWVQIRF